MSDIEMILDQMGLEKATSERHRLEHALRNQLKSELARLRIQAGAATPLDYQTVLSECTKDQDGQMH